MRHLYGRKPLEFDFALPTPHNRKPRLHRLVVLAVIAAAVITIFSMETHVNDSMSPIDGIEKGKTDLPRE